MERDIDLRVNFLSTNRKVGINSDGEFFKVGDKVKHDGADDNEQATIISFDIDEENEEVKVHTSLGYCHLDFLYK